MITPSTTHQQTQMIVDSVEGIYQNTLTIAQSVTGDNLNGTYNCMVENFMGSSSRTIYVYSKNNTIRIFMVYDSVYYLVFTLRTKALYHVLFLSNYNRYTIILNT